eukprot:3195383-Amphidinium_carterae.1
MQERAVKSYRKIPRLARLRRAGGKVKHLARAGVRASMMWGSATIGVAATKLRYMRSKLTRATRKLPKRASPGVTCAVDQELATIDPAQVLHTTQGKMCVNALQRHAITDSDAWAALAYVANRLLQPNHRGQSCMGQLEHSFSHVSD